MLTLHALDSMSMDIIILTGSALIVMFIGIMPVIVISIIRSPDLNMFVSRFPP